MSNDDYLFDLEDIQLHLNKENSSHFLIQRYIIECAYLSPEAKGYYAMYSSAYFEWEDIPKEIRDELNSITPPQEVKE
jgi:hypothetical protein